MAARVAADVMVRYLVAQPVACAREDLHVLGQQAYLFVQLTKHRLLGRLTVIDAALRKLPRMRAQPLAPENLIARVEQDDADVGPEAFTVEHNQTSIY